MGWRESFTNPVFHIPLNLFLEITVVLGDAQAIDPELFRTWVIPIFSYRLHNFITVVRMTASVFPFPTIAVDAQLFVFGYFHKFSFVDGHLIERPIHFLEINVHFDKIFRFLTKIQKGFEYSKGKRNDTFIY